MSALAREQIAYLADLNVADLEWFDGVCTDLAQGSSLTEAYAKVSHSIAVPWPVIRMWFKANEVLERRYQDALAARLEWRREAAAANVARIAMVEHDAERVRVSDTLAAADMVLNPKQGFVVGAGSGAGRVSIEVEFVDARPAEIEAHG